MDIVALVAERKIEEAIENGLFDNLPAYGPIDCSLHGEAFITKWFREKTESWWRNNGTSDVVSSTEPKVFAISDGID